MNFQNLTVVEKAQNYLDNAFRAGQQAVMRMKSKKSLFRTKSPFEKTKAIEIERMQVVKNSIYNSFSTILKSFPTISNLPTFYYELTKITLDYYILKKSLGTLNWGREKADELARIYTPKIKGSRDFKQLEKARREFFGRLSSIVYQMDKALNYLEQARKTMKEFPTVKTETKTIALVGFPNVGKTTLLFKMTGSQPEISDYAFTTKRINISYYKHNNERIQVMDTPGTLNRFAKMNMIEKQAYLAMKYCADIFVYVFDLSEPYPFKEQEKLFKSLTAFKKPIIVYFSKQDILPPELMEKQMKKYKGISDFVLLKEKLAVLMSSVRPKISDNATENSN